MSNKTKKSLKNKKKLFIPIKKISKDTIIPEPSKPGDAGADARIIGFKKILSEENKRELQDIQADSYILKPLERIGCPLGFATAIPEGYYFKVVPRSGLALWEGISIVNSPGTIDEGFKDEVCVIFVNLSNKEVILKKGDRICQIILCKMHEYEFIDTESLNQSERGLKGFGSTGKK